MTIIYDFTGTNGDPLPSGLIEINGTSQISNNKAKPSGSTPSPNAAWFFGTDDVSQTGTELSDGTVSGIINFEGVASGVAGILARYSDLSNYWIGSIFAASGSIYLQKVQGGSFTSYGPYAISGFSASTNYKVSIVMLGDSIELFLDDVSQHSLTSTFNQTAFVHGFRTTSFQASIDDLTVPGTAAADSITADSVNSFIQRESGNISVTVSGTYVGSPTSIRRKVVYTDDISTVSGFDWATYIASPSGNAFTGAAIVLPESTRQYRVDLDFSNDALVTDSTNGFDSADKWLIYGQSRGLDLSTDGNTIAANARTKYSNITTGAYTDPVGGDGAKTFLNALATETGFYQVALNPSYDGMALVASNAVPADNYMWDPVDPDTVRYLEVKAALAATGGSIAGAIFVQGERDASGANELASYKDNILAHFTQLRADTKAALPVVVVQLGNASSGVDSTWEQVKQAQADAANENANIYYTVSYDLTLKDNIHLDVPGNIKLGQRLANTIITNVLGGSADWESPTLASVTALTSTTTRLTIAHGQGTDFTPTSAITGIELTETGDGYAVTGISAARETASTILVTHDAATVTAGRVYYGVTPDFSNLLLDNSTLTLPLAPATVEATTLPIDATATLGTITYTSNNATIDISGSIDITATLGTITYASQSTSVSITGGNIDINATLGTISYTSNNAVVTIGAGALIGSVTVTFAPDLSSVTFNQ